jgi:hypothetical protein
MSGMFSAIANLIVGDDTATKPKVRKGASRRDLIRLESTIGRELFGPVPAGHRREFFNLDNKTWVWHEEWTDSETGKAQEVTTRYEVHPNGILKVQDGQPYRFLEGEELQYFDRATQLYYERVMTDIYHHDPATGQPLRPYASTNV